MSGSPRAAASVPLLQRPIPQDELWKGGDEGCLGTGHMGMNEELNELYNWQQEDPLIQQTSALCSLYLPVTQPLELLDPVLVH